MHPPLLRFLPVIAILGLTGCTAYSSPPTAAIQCEQEMELEGDWAYLQCVRMLSQPTPPAPAAASPKSAADRATSG